jgi:predicted nucleotidyltransferase
MEMLFKQALKLAKFLQAHQWRYCFIGGIALQRWGEPRLTRDIDITIITGIGEEETYIDLLLEAYSPRFPDAKDFALKNRVLLLVTEQKIPIDVALGAVAFEEKLVDRASEFEFLPGLSLRTCSAEDLVVLKAFADRSRDWADIETVLIRQKNLLHWEYIMKELRILCDLKESPEIPGRLEKMKDKIADFSSDAT